MLFLQKLIIIGRNGQNNIDQLKSLFN